MIATMKRNSSSPVIAHVIQSGDNYAGYVYDTVSKAPTIKMVDEVDEFSAHRILRQMVPEARIVTTKKFLKIVDESVKRSFK